MYYINFFAHNTFMWLFIQFTFTTYLPLTFTVNVHCAQFPNPSRAWQITLVSPIANWLPDFMLHDTLGRCPELSVASGSAQTTTAVDFPNSVDFDWLPGQDNMGDSKSGKKRFKLHNNFSYYKAIYQWEEEAHNPLVPKIIRIGFIAVMKEGVVTSRRVTKKALVDKG